MWKRLFLALLVCVPCIAQAQLTEALATQHVVSSFKVLTAQVSLAADQRGQSMMQSQQAFSSNSIDAFMREKLSDAVDQYGSTGQLVDGCYQVGMASIMGGTAMATGKHAQTALSRLYIVSADGTASAGGVAGAFGSKTQITQFPFAATVEQRASRHSARYCSVSEAQLGYCSLNANGMQAGDQDFSMHLQPGRTYGWDQVEAATDFTKRVAPMVVPEKSVACDSAACNGARHALREQEALMSMSRFSFMRFTEARSAQKSGEGSTQ